MFCRSGGSGVGAQGGGPTWRAPFDGVTAVALSNQSIYAGTERGEIHKLDLQGNIAWTRRLEGIVTPLPEPDTPSVPIRRPTGTPTSAQLPAGKRENLARGAKATCVLSNKRTLDASFLVDGKVEQRRVLRYPRRKWSVLASVGYGGLVLPAVVVLEFPQPVTLSTIAIHDGKKHEPYTMGGLTFQPNPIMRRWLGETAPADLRHSAVEFLIEAEVDGQWVPLARVRDNRLPYHVHTFEPVTTRKIRYTSTVTGDGEFWCEEIEAYR